MMTPFAPLEPYIAADGPFSTETLLMSLGLILLSVNINFVAFSSYLNLILGQVFAMFILTVAAAEAAIGLAILVVFFRSKGSIAVDDVSSMKG